MNYTTAIVAVALGTLASAVAVALFRDGDNTVLIGLIFAAAVPTTTGLMSFIKSQENAAELAAANAKLAQVDRKTNELQITVDGRLTQLLEARTDAAHSAGVLSGQHDERYRAALIAAPPPAHEVISPGSDGDTTTIVVSPASAATIESTAGPKGTAQPGDTS